MAISPNSTRLAATWHRDHGEPEGRLYEFKVWDTASGKELFTIPGNGAAAFDGAAFSPDNRHVASAARIVGGTGEVKIWDTATHEELLALKDPTYPIDNAAFSPDGRRLLGVLSSFLKPSGMVHIWDATPLQESVKGGP